MENQKEKSFSGGAVIAFIVVFAVLLTLTLRVWVHYGRTDPAAEMKPLGKIPAFSLKNQQNKIFTNKNLQGKVWAASFIFTSCKGICPMLTSTMTRLQKAMPRSPDFHMVSISVDPVKDTPAELLKYARRVGADTTRWTFLTGSKEAIRNLSIGGFKLGVRPGVRVGDKKNYDITHSKRIVLVDKKGRIRAYFDGTDAKQYPRLKKAALALLAEK